MQLEAIPNKKFITTRELQSLGYSYYRIGGLEKDGTLSRINRSAYENMSYHGEENDFYSAEAFVPYGVICLLSAARYYELTDFLPDTVDVAIERKKKVSTLPAWPSIHIYYFSSVRMETGVREIQEDDNCFHIFDVEKTVVDIVSFRNKVGIEETAEILKNYLKREGCQIDKLYQYAKLLHCDKTLRTYLEVLLT